jgi:hypothetical protein
MNTTRSYTTLRFIAFAIEYIGVVIILGSWVFSLLWWTSVNATWQASEPNQSPPALFEWLRDISWMLPVVSGSIGTITGMMMVAWGQVIQVFLDIRDDTHTTMRLISQGGATDAE